MKKQTKAAIAAGSAALLFAGGAATMAAWSDSETIGGGTVNSGELSIEQTGSPAWAFTTPGKPGVFVPADDLIVPGDIVTYTAEYNIAFAGTNLEAELNVDTGSITGTGDLLSRLDIDIAATSDATELPGDGTAVAITESGLFNVVVTIEFLDTDDQIAQNDEVSLEEFNLLLTQTAPAIYVP